MNYTFWEANFSRDFAHEQVQLAAFTQSAPLYHLINIVAAGRLNDYISYSWDLLSGRYSDADFNSDLDAINIYYIMQKTGKSYIEVAPYYNYLVLNDRINRVQEFKKTLSSNENIADAMLYTRYDNLDFVGGYIASDHTAEEIEQYKKDFFNYLERGKYENVK